MFSNKSVNTNIQLAFKPLHLVAKLVGLAPYTFIRNTQSGEETIDVTWKHNRSSIIWSLLLVIVEIIATVYRMTLPAPVSGSFVSLLELPLVHISGFVPIIIVLSINRGRMQQFVTMLSRVDNGLIQSSDNIYRKHKAKIIVFLVCFLAFIITAHVLFIYFWENDKIFCGILLGVADFTGFINDTGMVNLVILLQGRLAALNTNIGSIFVPESCVCEANVSPSDRTERNRKCRFLTSPYFGDISEAELHFRLQLRSTHTSIPEQTAVSCYQSKVIERITACRRMYQKLYDICCLINLMYGFTLLLSTICHTTCFVSDVYHTIHYLVTTYCSEGRMVSRQKVTLFLIFSLIRAVRIIYVTLPCQKTGEEYEKCIDHVQELLLYSDQTRGIITQLKLFSNQLENNKIEFTAYGFFFVNLSLLTSLTGVTVTYIIFLIQV
jgi:hypothetical protein